MFVVGFVVGFCSRWFSGGLFGCLTWYLILFCGVLSLYSSGDRGFGVDSGSSVSCSYSRESDSNYIRKPVPKFY